MKVLLWIGNESNQIALANKISERFEIVGMVTESKISRTKLTPILFIEKIIERIFLNQLRVSWFGMKRYYQSRFPSYPETDRLDVTNINRDEVAVFTKSKNPDVIVVSGTRLIKERLLSIEPSIGILNLHTGLSPYIKGGPNCTNWCLATRQPYLIGNTVMWIDKGIDSGDILTTELTRLSGEESLTEIHIKVMEHAHDLYLVALDFLKQGRMSRVKQTDIAEGKTYFTRQWTLRKKIQLIKGMKYFREYKASSDHIENASSIQTISIR